VVFAFAGKGILEAGWTLDVLFFSIRTGLSFGSGWIFSPDGKKVLVSIFSRNEAK
jgi:hypothetical protein